VLHPALTVVVSGPPASGKSTLAPALAERLGLPLLAKDTIKDALMRVLPVPDLAASRELGRASVVAMLAIAAENPGVVLESAWQRSRAIADLRALPGPIVEVFCRCDRPTLETRYRARSVTRSAGHFDAVRTSDELWGPETTEPVAGGWPVMIVDHESRGCRGGRCPTVRDDHFIRHRSTGVTRPPRGQMGAGCPPLTGHCSGRVWRDARTGVRLLTCSVPVGVRLMTRRRCHRPGMTLSPCWVAGP